MASKYSTLGDEADGREVKREGGGVVILGVLLLIAGIAAISCPLMAGTMATVLIGTVMLVGGIFELIGAMHAGGWKAGLVGFLSGALSLLAGGAILARPLLGLSVLTLVLAIYFLIDGVGKIMLALKVKPRPAWGVVLFGGIVTLLLGLMIWRRWPLSGVWAVGTLIGVNMLMSGMNMIALGSFVRGVAKEAEADEPA